MTVALGRKVMTNLDSILKSRDITLPTRVHLVKAVVFSVVMYGCEIWTVKKAEHERIDAFELWFWRRLLNALDCKEIQPVHPKGNQSWIFIGRTDAEAETPILWLPDTTNWLIWKDPDAGKDLKTGGWESHFLGRLIRSLGVPKEKRGLEFSKRKKGQTFFSLYIP